MALERERLSGAQERETEIQTKISAEELTGRSLSYTKPSARKTKPRA